MCPERLIVVAACARGALTARKNCLRLRLRLRLRCRRVCAAGLAGELGFGLAWLMDSYSGPRKSAGKYDLMKFQPF